MSELFLKCDKCHANVLVEPSETLGYRSVSCQECGAELVFLNAELKTRPASQPAHGYRRKGANTKSYSDIGRSGIKRNSKKRGKR